MEVEIRKQAAALIFALLLGAADGLLYDVLRPVRYRTGTAGGIVFDTVFCCAAAFGAFVYAMGAGGGRLGVMETGVIGAGFIGYIHILSPIVYPILAILAEKIVKGADLLKKFLKKIVKFANFFFKKAYDCFIIKGRAGH